MNSNYNFQKAYVIDYCRNNNLLPYIDGDNLILLYISCHDREICYKYLRMIEDNLSFLDDEYKIINKKEQLYIDKSIVSEKPITYNDYLEYYDVEENDNSLYDKTLQYIMYKNHKKVIYEHFSKFYQVFYSILYNNYCDLEFIYNFLCEFLGIKPIIYNKPDYFPSNEVVDFISNERCNVKEMQLDLSKKNKYVKGFFKFLGVDVMCNYKIEDIFYNKLDLLCLGLSDKVQKEALIEYAKFNTKFLEILLSKDIIDIKGDINIRKK